MDLHHADKLSEAARNALRSPSPAYEQLVVTGDHANAHARRQLGTLDADALLDPPAASREHREALLAGLWLWHDFLDESHAVSQRIESPTGSVWRGIMRDKGEAQSRKKPTLVKDLRKMLATLPDGLAGVRDRALLLFRLRGCHAAERTRGAQLGRPGADR